jgi:integrase
VAALVDSPRVIRKEIKPLSPEQARALLNAACDHRFGPLVTIAVSLGLRQGEALGWHWRDVDFKARTLSVRQALQFPTGGGWVLVEPKSDRSRRTINIPEIVVTALRTQSQTAGITTRCGRAMAGT